MMHAFLGRVEAQMREGALWRRETEAQWEETRESLERIVMHKVLYACNLCTCEYDGVLNTNSMIARHRVLRKA